MRRYEIYLDNNDRLCLAKFNNRYNEYESNILKGINTYEEIRNIASDQILSARINKADLTIQFKKSVVNLSEYQKLIQKRGMAPLINKLKNYYEKEKMKKVKHKKVKRKNKHTGRKIIAIALVIAMLCSYKYFLFEKKLSAYVDGLLKSPISSSFSINKNDPNKEIINIKIEEDNKEKKFIFVDYEDNSSTKKAIYAKENYGVLITKYARQYGIDPALALGVATQERGIHSSVMDAGGATGLMQIQNSVWVGQTVSAYNFETKQWETFKITLDNIGDLETNIKIGCMILQNTMQYMKNNIPAAIQCYNMGSGNMNIILNAYAKSQNKTIDEVLSDPTDIGWLEYRNLIKVGDAKYLEHVLQWIGDEINIKNVKVNGELVKLSISNEFKTKKVY